jgi:hypothetical protein
VLSLKVFAKTVLRLLEAGVAGKIRKG